MANHFWQAPLIWIGKILLAAVLGGAIGFERESHGQAAGLRTNLLVGIGSCLLMMLSLHIEEMFRAFDMNSAIRVDPGRLASYTVASMGFLGAGSILKGKGSVRGLTTAAGLWLVTGIGLAVGSGYILVVLYNFRFLKELFTRDVYINLTLTCVDPDRRVIEHVTKISDDRNIEIRFIDYDHDLESNTATYRFRLCMNDNIPWGLVVRMLQTEIPGLDRLAWEEGDVP